MGNNRTRRNALGAGVLALGLTGAGAWAGECSSGAVFLRGDWGEARFSVEVADDSAERAQGLMHRESMASAAGMLFVYEKPQTASFWMRNTLIPLDMLFVDSRGVVQHIHHMAKPHDESAILGGDNILAVLEINGGMAKKMRIAQGSSLRHPAFSDNNPAWPC